MFTFQRFVFSNSWCFGLALMLILSTNLSALEYEFSDNGADGVEFEGGRTEFEFADINNDGHVDFLTIGDHGSPMINTNQHGIMVFFGDGTGRWDVTMRGDFGYGGITVGDVNNDGDWDVGYANHHPYADDDFGNQNIEVVLGDGSGENWEPWDDDLAVPRGDDDWYGMFGADFGDFNNDGLLDIGSNSFGSGTGLHVYSNNDDGSWEDVLYHFWRNNSCMDFVFGDMNNDGNLDFACALEEKEVHWGDGEGNFEFNMYNLPNPPEFEVYLGVDLGDVNNDGADDLAFIDHNCRVRVFTFDPERERWDEISDGLPDDDGCGWGIDLCDMDVDGNPDIIFSHAEGIEVWLQDPGGDPRWNQEWSMGFEDYSGIQAIKAGGDIDHNGMPDIVLLVRIRTGFMQTQNFLHVLRETSEAEELWIRPVEPGGGEVFVAGSVRFIDWAAAIPDEFNADNALVDLYFSPRGPDDDWIEIAEGIPNGGRFQWTVPEVESRNCYIRYVLDLGDDVVEGVTRAPFTIIGGERMPMLAVDPRRIEFEEVVVENPEEQPLTIRNIGFADLTVEPVELVNGEAFSVEGGDEEMIIEPDHSVEITVIFDPPEPGFWDDTIIINSDGGNIEVTLIGTTEGFIGPLVEVSADTIDFGRVRVDETGSNDLIVYSRGDVDAVVNIPAAGDGIFTWEPVEQEHLEPDDSLNVAIDFTPLQFGAAEQLFTLNYQAGEISVVLMGIGFGQGMIDLSTDMLDFGPVLVNSSSEKNLIVHSVGDEPAMIDVLPLDQGPFSIDPIEDRALNPGDSLSIPVTFEPDEAGDFSTGLTVRSQAQELHVNLCGTGMFGPLVEAPEDTLDFGIILVDQRRILNLILRSLGNENAIINIDRPAGAAFSCNRRGEYDVRPGDSLVARVSFGPWIDMEYQGSLNISYQREDFEVILIGKAVTEFSMIENPGVVYSFGFVELSPNPFNDELNIKYTLDRRGEVELSLCDLRGRYLNILANKTQNAGFYSITMPADGLTSGTYLIVLKHQDRREIRKVIHLK